MENTFIDMLLETEIGKFIVFAGGAILVIFGLYKTIIEIKKIYDKRIKSNLTKSQETEEFRQKVLKAMDNDRNIAESIEKISDSINTLSEEFSEFREETKNTLSLMENKQKAYSEEISTLMESDKEAIKAYIIEQYQKYYKLKYIDIYTMECIEKRYEKYLKENGNTFISILMKRLRALPTKYLVNDPDLHPSCDDNENP